MKKLILLLALSILSCNKPTSEASDTTINESALSPEQQLTVQSYKETEWQADSAASVVDFMVAVSEDGENPQVKKAIDLQTQLSQYVGKESSPKFRTLLDQYVQINNDLLSVEKEFVKHQTTKDTRQFLDQVTKE